MSSDRGWIAWCQKEFLAKMKAKGKVEIRKEEAMQRKVTALGIHML